MKTRFFLIFALAATIFFTTARAQQSQWRPVSGNPLFNISGMALIDHTADQTRFLVVHDNKNPSEVRAGIITIAGSGAPTYDSLKWPGDDIPVDLESVTAVPYRPNKFMALASWGHLFYFEVNATDKTISVIKALEVPQIPPDRDFEGFALQKAGDSLLAVWADRGLDNKPATLFWARFDLKTFTFSAVDKLALHVPYPTTNVRHISDVKVDPSGAVFISSACDPGDLGPFGSAVYMIGVFDLSDSKSAAFVPSQSPVRLFRFNYHKIEALELVPSATGGIAFGTDDEFLGESIYLDW